jgi:hypothetical protein
MILRTRLTLLAHLLAAWLPMSALAQPAKVPDPINPRALAINPAAAPVPALKYRLLPSSADLNPGDAAPVYLRIRYQTADSLWNEIGPNYIKWRNLPLNQFPTAEARKFVDQYSKQLEQTDFGAHRKTCDWNYTLAEQRLDVINVALSDAQGLRQWLQLLHLKARVEIAEGKYDQAVRTIETGLAFSRHIAEGPFLINGLIGLAGINLLLAEVDELIEQPGAPNLYWALSALPRPLIDIRRETETERKLCENLIPGLTEAGSDGSRTAAEWALLLSRMHQGIVKWSRIIGTGGLADSRLKALSTWDLARLKAESLPAARAYLKESRGLGDQQLADRSDDQIVALYLAGRYDELWDDLFKASYLPARDAIPQLAAAENRLAAAKSGPLALFDSTVPALRSVMASSLRTDRHIAALRVIEALRLYAAAHDGQLPESLDQIKEVPVPEDPATGEPFIYRAADSAAILHGLRADLPPPGLSYRITIRH